MYLIKSHDSFFMETILNLLMQKNFPINIDNKSRIYGTINFKFSQDTLSIKYENDVLNLNTPTDFNKLWKGLYKLLLNPLIMNTLQSLTTVLLLAMYLLLLTLEVTFLMLLLAVPYMVVYLPTRLLRWLVSPLQVKRSSRSVLLNTSSRHIQKQV